MVVRAVEKARKADALTNPETLRPGLQAVAEVAPVAEDDEPGRLVKQGDAGQGVDGLVLAFEVVETAARDQERLITPAVASPGPRAVSADDGRIGERQTVWHDFVDADAVGSQGIGECNTHRHLLIDIAMQPGPNHPAAWWEHPVVLTTALATARTGGVVGLRGERCRWVDPALELAVAERLHILIGVDDPCARLTGK